MTQRTKPAQKWTCIHLSDIHFKTKSPSDEWVTNADLRQQLLIDLRRLKGEGQDFNAILVSGDIAFSGQPNEYDDAVEFLSSACESIGIPRTEVWVVPGNHDVNRASIKFGTREWHKRVKAPQAFNRQPLLDEVLSLPDDDPQDYLLGSLRNYNDFASKYSCQTTLDPIFYWEAEMSARLSDGVVLKVRGLNSAFICNQNDHPGHTLLLGRQQMLLEEAPNVAWIVMCHHPATWLADGSQLMTLLRNRASIALFGHEHLPEDIQYGNLFVLHAGAINPERGELEEPAYNVLSFWVNNQRQLVTEIQRRTYRRDLSRFAPFLFDGEQSTFTHHSKLKDIPTGLKNLPKVTAATSAGGEQSAVPEISDEIIRRRLNYYFFDLPEGARMTVVNSLGLVTPEFSELSGRKLFMAIIDEAQRRGELRALWREIAKNLMDMPMDPVDEVIPSA